MEFIEQEVKKVGGYLQPQPCSCSGFQLCAWKTTVVCEKHECTHVNPLHLAPCRRNIFSGRFQVESFHHRVHRSSLLTSLNPVRAPTLGVVHKVH